MPDPQSPRRAPSLGDVPQDGDLAELCVRAVTVAAADLGLDPLAFAGELAQGEVALLVSYLSEAVEHVDDLDLRTRIDNLLYRLTAWTGEPGD